ncbi:MAG: NUDIX domain-containing protein [Pseudomonadota bacterium]
MTIREIVLLCHGEAKKDADDITRPLKSKSKRQAQKLGAWMREQGIVPDVCLASPAERALVTAQKALKAGGWTAQHIVADRRLYDAPVADHLAALSDRAAACMLCVGHPGALTDVLHHLAPDGPALGHGTLARLRLSDGALQTGAARVEQVVVAENLPEGFAYPGPGATERRARPAYYYAQSAALPYRHHRGVFEVLLITSGSGRKWGIPKGICEPGLTAQASAAQEALEEAGVVGRPHPDSLGRYELVKWGATCSVDVYPMAVARALPDSERDERHRQRIWLRPDKAAARVDHPGLARIIARFTKPVE